MSSNDLDDSIKDIPPISSIEVNSEEPLSFKQLSFKSVLDSVLCVFQNWNT